MKYASKYLLHQTRLRKIEPIKIHYGVTGWYKGEQWLLEAVDMEDPARPVKTFAMKDIHFWEASVS